MQIEYVMDTLFDLLNESDALNLQELEEKEKEGKFYLTTGDGTRILVHCHILP